ncbi:YceI family protein [Pseudogemmobacter sonorensis]|uniref:YceI family protein n=1 Tax=Pseudogemmobacter sonorensis TaxID=2989681 RepID=UPI00367A209D
MNRILPLALTALFAAPAFAEPVKYDLDPTHSAAAFSYSHLGFSTTRGIFGGVTGTIDFDAEAPENSAVEISFPIAGLATGDAGRDGHFLSGDFFDAAKSEVVTFKSTSIEVTGEDTGLITGDLSLNGVTKEIVIDAKLNFAGTHPMANTEWLGFDGTVTLIRSDFGLGMFAPAIADEVLVEVSIEAGKAAE